MDRLANPQARRLHLRDLYWVAGIVEGEGCIRIKTSHGKPQLSLVVAMTDQDVVARVASILGVPMTGPYKCGLSAIGTPRKDSFKATVSANARAAAWMMTLYPLCGIRRQSKIRECLSVWKSTIYQRRNYGQQTAGAGVGQDEAA